MRCSPNVASSSCVGLQWPKSSSLGMKGCSTRDLEDNNFGENALAFQKEKMTRRTELLHLLYRGDSIPVQEPMDCFLEIVFLTPKKYFRHAAVAFIIKEDTFLCSKATRAATYLACFCYISRVKI